MNTPKKVALITGASRGIGREIALRLARDGFAIVVNYAGNAARAEDVVREITTQGGKAMAVQADVADALAVAVLFDTAINHFGHIDVVVNSAGVMDLSRIAEADLDAFDHMIRTNLRGAYIVLGKAAQHVADGGRIIGISTSVIAKSFPGYGAYIASKAGMEGLIHVLANELRGRNITVNAVAPGPVATELFLNGKSAEQIAQLAKMPPIERLGQPDDIADVVSFLASDQGGWINSQVVRANGGYA